MIRAASGARNPRWGERRCDTARRKAPERPGAFTIYSASRRRPRQGAVSVPFTLDAATLAVRCLHTLASRTPMAAWAFQADPSRYRILSALLDHEDTTWLVKRYADQIEVGDDVLL